MEEKPKLKGRKRQPAKRTAAAPKQEDPAAAGEGSAHLEASAEAEATVDEPEPKPTLSQRLTRSLRQLSQLGGQPKQGEEAGEEVEQEPNQGQGGATPREEGRSGGPTTPDTEPPPTARRLRFGRPPKAAATVTAAGLAALLLLAAVAAGAWRQQARAADALGRLDAQLRALHAAGAQHARQLHELQQAQAELEGRLAGLASSQRQLREALASEGAAAAAAAAAAGLQAQLEQVQAAVGEQAVHIRQLQQAEGAEVGGTAGTPVHTAPPPGLDAEQVAGLARAEVEKALEVFDADCTGQPDYALASMGGRVLGHSPLLQHPSNAGLVDALGRLLGTHSVHPQADKFLLTPGASLGECLPLAGSSGFVDIQLVRAVHPTGLTYQHVPAAIAYDIRTAPRTLAIYALDGPAADGAAGSASHNASSNAAHGSSREATLLGQGAYNALHGTAAQHIAFAWPSEGRWPVGRVRVVVQDNHGHPNATCLYRIRVHGAAVSA